MATWRPTLLVHQSVIPTSTISSSANQLRLVRGRIVNLTTEPAAAAALATLTVADILQILQGTGIQIGALATQVQNLTTNQAAAAQAATQVAAPRPPDSKKTV